MAAAQNGSVGEGRPSMVRRLVPLALLLGASVAVLATGLHRHLSLQELSDRRETLLLYVAENRLAALAAYSGVYVASVALSLPGAVILTLMGGFLFGWIIGGALAAVAATIGATLVFLVARTALGDLLAQRAGGRLARLADGFREDAFSYLLFLRLVPLFPFWLVNLAPALLGVPLRSFVLATLIGILPGSFAFAILGSSLDALFAAQEEAQAACRATGGAGCAEGIDVAALVTPELVMALAALGVLALVPVAAKRWSQIRTARLAARNGAATRGLR